jgi:DNA-binding NarL/FixJ family response regulator
MSVTTPGASAGHGTTVVVVDDQAMIRAGVRGILQGAPDLSVVGEAADGDTGVRMCASLRPDVVLMDLRMPVLDGIEAIRRLRSMPDLESLRILVLTTFDDDPDVLAALQAGADGFLSKVAEPAELVDALRGVAAGDVMLSQTATRAVVQHVARAPRPAEPDPVLAQQVASLTPRERTIVEQAARGLDNLQISRQLHISPHTVKTHLGHAMAKLDVRDRTQMVVVAFRAGLV